MNPAAAKLKLWRENPVEFVRDVFGVEPDEWQKDVLIAFPTHNRLVMKACKGPGKTCLLAWLVWNFLLTRPYPKIACTSVSSDNLSDGLWTELAKWQQKSELLKKTFEWTKTRITCKEAPETWWASARSWSKSADSSQQANTLAGLHADYMLFVCDEMGDYPDSVMAAAEAALASGIETKLLGAGNPTKTDGPLYRACTQERELWHVTEITADPDDPKRTPRVSPEWAKEQIVKYGRDNPWVMVNVFGKFPPTSVNALLGPDDMAAVMGKHVNPRDYSHSPVVLGVDIARFGDDRTVIFPRQGIVAFEPVIMRGARSEEIAAKIGELWDRLKASACFIDNSGGWAVGVIDLLQKTRYAPIPVSFNGKPRDPRYRNKRAEMHFDAAEWVKAGGALPMVLELTKEATASQYFFHQDKFQLEDKQQVKERIGVSPDLWDAFVLTFAQSVMNTHRTVLDNLLSPVKHEYDYNPFEGL